MNNSNQSNEKYIEFICTGNQGRSPVAELIAKIHLKKIGAEDYLARSSGTLVKAAQSGQISDDMMIGIINSAKGRNINAVYSNAEIRSIDEAIELSNMPLIKAFYDKAVTRFAEEEVGYRMDALKEFGIIGDVKHVKDQTKIRQDTIALFPMDLSNFGRTEKIYTQSAHRPVLVTLGSYVTGDFNADVPNSYGKDRDAYMRSFEKIMEYTPKAIDKLLNTR